jgi:UDP-glucuronate decarboxylase
MKILITGAAGLLGIELTKQLLDAGHEVDAIDNFYTSSRNNIKQFKDNDNYTFVQHDITYPLPNVFWNQREWDQIYNLACPASPIHYQRDPQYTLDCSLVGVRNMLKLAEGIGAVFIQASTSETYGDPLEHPQAETYWGNVNTLGPRACYDEGKRAAETMCLLSSTRCHIARIFNTYGPNMALNDGRAVSNFITQALTDAPITLHGTGKQTRSFCYVEDTVRGLILLANSDAQGPVNIGNPDEVELIELVNEILHLTASKSEISWQPAVVDDPGKRCPDISKAKEVLNWEPTVSRSAGLGRTISKFIQRMNSE